MEQDTKENQNLNPVEPNNPAPKKKNELYLALGAVVLILMGIAGYLLLSKSQDTSNNSALSDILNTPTVIASSFANYEEVSVNVNPKVPFYSIDPNLSNVSNRFTLSEAAKSALAKNSFVITPEIYQEFFKLYEPNRYAQLPNFITTDSMLHNYHLMFDYLLKKLEEQKLAAELKNLNNLMLASSLQQYNSLKDTEWENAAKRNVGFFAVASKLSDTDANVPDFIKNEVNQELSLIEAHQNIHESPVMNIGRKTDTIIDTPQGAQSLEALKEDYSQYVPRGHYDKSDSLKSYFKSMMWYGRLTFRFKNDDEIRSALLITLLLNNKEAGESWNKIYEPTNFFVGKSDDINYYQLEDTLDDVYGNNSTLQSIVSDKAKFASFVESLNQLEPPQVNSVPIFNAAIQPDREKEIKGFRFMGQRFTLDASMFQRLVYREVGTDDLPRMLPKALDVPAAMGSGEALNILKSSGEDKYANYSENMAKLREYTSGLKKEAWTQNLYWGWLYQLLPLLQEKPEGYPIFMRNLAWTRKELNTYLGSWTELKHDTILYAKQSYAELGGGGDEEKLDDRGYVEPNAYLYARLASLVKMTREGLEIRGLLTADSKENLGNLEELALKLKTISEKELNNESLSDEDYELIRSYGGQLEHIWGEAYKDDCKDANMFDCLDENPAPIVADVATDPNGTVLEEGTGYINAIYVVVPIDGKLRVAKGGVYSYYEFAWPLSDRLTDKKWREMLESGSAPKLPDWTQIFMSK